MNDTDIATLRNGYDLINQQVGQIERELDGHRGMVKTLEGMRDALLSSVSVVEHRLKEEGVDLSPPAAQLEIPFEVVK